MLCKLNSVYHPFIFRCSLTKSHNQSSELSQTIKPKREAFTSCCHRVQSDIYMMMSSSLLKAVVESKYTYWTTVFIITIYSNYLKFRLYNLEELEYLRFLLLYTSTICICNSICTLQLRILKIWVLVLPLTESNQENSKYLWMW